jgi:hypothetical protein
MSEWLDTSKMVNSFIVDDGRYHKPDTKAAYIIIRDLKFIIKNKEFQKVIEKFVYNAHYFNDVSLILACKAWLIRNKGKYEINKFYCPY